MDVIGQYTMQTVDGKALPVMLSSGDGLLSGPLVLRIDSTFPVNPLYRMAASFG